MKTSGSKSDLLKELVDQACASQDLAGMESVVEKELLHYDIMAALSQSGLLAKLVFQGGTCLRMAYGSARLSEDLDFVGGRDFSPELYQNLAQVLIDYLKPRYGLDVQVKLPKHRAFRSDSVSVGRWMISIETKPLAKHLPNQKIKLEVANIPSYSLVTRALKLNYPSLQAGLSTVLINCESEEEIAADKVVALCLRNFIKARDLWDLVMLNQKGIAINDEWVKSKFDDYQSDGKPVEKLHQRLSELPIYWQSGEFENEMRRFLPRKKIQETFDQGDFMAYFTQEVEGLLQQLVKKWQQTSSPQDKPKFNL
jgi:predicted nucleotidyltransferase component of viral defense system